MIYMQKEIIEQFKHDIQNGTVKALKLIKEPTEVIRNNCYALIFDTIRPIVKFDDKRFYLRTQLMNAGYSSYNGIDYMIPDRCEPTGKYEDLEAYYDAFDYYDGEILRKTEVFSSVNNQETDQIHVTEYRVFK